MLVYHLSHWFGDKSMAAMLTVAASFCALLVEAQESTNAPHPATDKTKVGWVSSAPRRSTMNIVWSCVSVLLVCTYKCVHLNISSFEENQAGWHKAKFCRLEIPYWPEDPLIWKGVRKIKWLAIILVAPELGVAIAFDQFIAARKELKRAKYDFPEEEQILTLTHAFYATMGGFAVAGEVINKQSSGSIEHRRKSCEPRSQLPDASTIQPALLEKPRFRCGEITISERKVTDEEHDAGSVNTNPEDKSASACSDYKALRVLDLSTYVRICKTLPPCPNQIVTEESLNDRSKSDGFTKAFAILQSTWLVVQSIARVFAGLPITELELATMAYVLCAVIMYGFWWSKPFGAEDVIIVPRPARYRFFWEPHWSRIKQVTDIRLGEFVFVGDTRKPAKPEDIFYFQQAVFYGVATAFAAVHLAAWNWEFPTEPTRIMWRVFGIAATAAGPCSMAIFYSYSQWMKVGFLGLTVIVCVVYVVSRLGLIVLIFYSFSTMPAAVYETVEWTTYFPYFG